MPHPSLHLYADSLEFQDAGELSFVFLNLFCLDVVL